MERLVTVVVPIDKSTRIMEYLNQSNLVMQTDYFILDNKYHLNFKTRAKYLDQVINVLESYGCGVHFGVINVVSLLLSRPKLQQSSHQKKNIKKYKINDRMTQDEIGQFIENGNHLTFDYIAMITVASIIAGSGLLSDSPTSVIASMLVSPLMGPILSITFGLATNDMSIISRGVKNEVIGVIICFVVGTIMGLMSGLYHDCDFSSQEIESRGSVGGLPVGFVVAAASAVGVVIAVSQGGISALVGTAISASLLPPIVNCGVCLAISAVVETRCSSDTAHAYLGFGLVSFLLWLINFVTITAVGFLTFRYVKSITPQRPTDTQLVSTQTSMSLLSSEADYEEQLLSAMT